MSELAVAVWPAIGAIRGRDSDQYLGQIERDLRQLDYAPVIPEDLMAIAEVQSDWMKIGKREVAPEMRITASRLWRDLGDNAVSTVIVNPGYKSLEPSGMQTRPFFVDPATKWLVKFSRDHDPSHRVGFLHEMPKEMRSMPHVFDLNEDFHNLNDELRKVS